MKVYHSTICKGDYRQGTACGQCEKCADQRLALMASNQWNKLANVKPKESHALNVTEKDIIETVEEHALWIEAYFMNSHNSWRGKQIALFLRNYRDHIKMAISRDERIRLAKSAKAE